MIDADLILSEGFERFVDCFCYPGLATFSAAARRSGLLKWLEYPGEDGGA